MPLPPPPFPYLKDAASGEYKPHWEGLARYQREVSFMTAVQALALISGVFGFCLVLFLIFATRV